mmetsp:Transcript_50805/g.148056  ORF Transcript_50805/g.148056 Transcript_50805/m.148056 type:complete len:210 (-) Transcript_50805:442-1071(-)
MRRRRLHWRRQQPILVEKRERCIAEGIGRNNAAARRCGGNCRHAHGGGRKAFTKPSHARRRDGPKHADAADGAPCSSVADASGVAGGRCRRQQRAKRLDAARCLRIRGLRGECCAHARLEAQRRRQREERRGLLKRSRQSHFCRLRRALLLLPWLLLRLLVLRMRLFLVFIFLLLLLLQGSPLPLWLLVRLLRGLYMLRHARLLSRGAW